MQVSEQQFERFVNSQIKEIIWFRMENHRKYCNPPYPRT